MTNNRQKRAKSFIVHSSEKLSFIQGEWLDLCAESVECAIPQVAPTQPEECEEFAFLVAPTQTEEHERLASLDDDPFEAENEPVLSTMSLLPGLSDGAQKIILDTSRSEQTSPYEPELGPLPPLYLALVLRCLRENEHGDAQIFATLFRERCVYDPSTQEWHLWLDHYWQRDWRQYPRILVSGPLASVYQKASILVMGQSLNKDSSKNERTQQKSVTTKQQEQSEQKARSQVARQRDQAEQSEQGGSLKQLDQDAHSEQDASVKQRDPDEQSAQSDHRDSAEQIERDEQREQEAEQEREPAMREEGADALVEHGKLSLKERVLGGRWSRSSGTVRQGQSDTLREAQQGVLSDDQQNVLKELGKRVTQLKALSRVQRVLAYAQTLLAVEPKVWDANPWVLGTGKGVIDLRTGTLRPGQPDDYIRTMIPTEWKGLDEPAPRFERFLREIFADRAEDERDELIAFLQRALGYGLTGNVNEHIFLMLYGEEGRNGKDTLMHALEHVLGSAVGAISQDVLIAGSRFSTPGNAKPHLCSLQGKRIAWASEPDEHARFAVNQIKLLTGGGDIVARQLYGREFTFQPTHLLILLSNHKLEANAADRAFWERFCPIIFRQRFVSHPERANEQLRDADLARDLEAEASGILAWLVRGALEWYRFGLAIPESVRRTRQEYRSSESTIESFITDCCTLDSEAQTPAGALYKAYRAWANENGLAPASNKQFGLEMKGINGVSVQHTKRHNLYVGIKPINVGEESDAEGEGSFSDDESSQAPS